MELRKDGLGRMAVLLAAVLVVGLANSAMAGDVFNACSSNKTSKLRSSSVLANATPVCKAGKETARTWNQAALGFAHVLAGGTVDGANSKNVVNANVSPGLNPGIYCFTGLPFSFQNATATAAWAGLGGGIDVVQVALGDPFGDCFGGTQLVAVTSNVTIGPTPLDFFIVFN
jgi:hypothetical protein